MGIIKMYTVTCSVDDTGVWLAEVCGVPGCHTQGPTLEVVKERIREALGVCVDDGATAELVFIEAAAHTPPESLPTANLKKVAHRYLKWADIKRTPKK